MGRYTEVLEHSFRSGTTPTTPHTGAINTIGSTCITNASISVDVTVADYVSVTQSGNYIVTLGSTNINNVLTGSVVQKTSPWIVAGSMAITSPGSVIQATNPWIVLGSQAITNVITGSCVQSTNPWVIIGSAAITNVLTGSCVQSTNPWIVLGSQAITNVITGSCVQSTNPWIVLGSQAITNVITGSVVQSTSPWVVKDAQYYPNCTVSKYKGIPCGGSAVASGTPFSGVSVGDGNGVAGGSTYIKNVTVYGGLGTEDILSIDLAGTYYASGVRSVASSSHSFEYDTPIVWASGAKLSVYVTNNTTKTANVNAVVKYLA